MIQSRQPLRSVQRSRRVLGWPCGTAYGLALPAAALGPVAADPLNCQAVPAVGRPLAAVEAALSADAAGARRSREAVQPCSKCSRLPQFHDDTFHE